MPISCENAKVDEKQMLLKKCLSLKSNIFVLKILISGKKDIKTYNCLKLYMFFI